MIVDELGVLLEDVVTLGARGVLELEYRLRIEEVVLTFAPPLILTTEVQVAVRAFDGPVGVGNAVASGDLLGDLVQTNAVEARDSAGEVLVDQLLRQANRLEHLGTAVGRDSGDAHLGHHLEHALARRFDVFLDCRVRVQAAQAVQSLGDEILD